MAEPSATADVWMQRVEAWRASGERAETFSQRAGFTASTLRWWASKLKRDAAGPPSKAEPEVRIARVARSIGGVVGDSQLPCVVLDVEFAGVRITVEPGAHRATLAMVLELIGVGVDS